MESEELRRAKPRISKVEGGLVSNKRKESDVIKSCCGARAFRELAFLVFCSVIADGLAAGFARAGSVKGNRIKRSGVMASKQATAKEVGLPVFRAKPHKTRSDSGRSNGNLGSSLASSWRW